MKNFFPTISSSASKIKKIGIDARFLGPWGKGLGRYTQKLVENLEEIDGDNPQREYFIFLRKQNFKDYTPKKENFKKILADYPWYSIKEQFLFPFFLRKFKLDLIHFCHFNVPIFLRERFVVTIHDLILLQFPTTKNTTRSKITYFLKFLSYQLVINSAIKKSEKIIAVSKFTAWDIKNKFKINPQKITIIHEGWEKKFFSNKKNKSNTDEILKKYGIIKPYLFYIGNAYPHKNLEKLVLAFREIRKRFPQFQLVLAGGNDFFFERLAEFIKKEEVSNIILTGFISEDDLKILYQEANLFVFPSLYEGFGLPPLEALACETPVAVSKIASMPEILGKNGAVWFDPNQIESIVQAIKKGITDVNLRKKIIEEGRKLKKYFSWKKMAQDTLKIYEKILSNI